MNPKKIRILYARDRLPHRTLPFRWTWDTGMKHHVYGRAATVDDIKKASEEIFPDREIELLDVSKV